ncbi:hypothetical protein [Amycolatopsis thermoflava]|uniref:hypothetical protein n=1 Tax=Amycolatopsis thermoflava TaxID=84480 RepID=UPI0004160548|nr:hypothetical protein [Amycolatopsis thermoflava]
MTNKGKVLPRIITAAIGLAARHFPDAADGGEVTVARDYVLYVLDGHVTDWVRWRTRLSDADAMRFARLLRMRTNQLANADMARRVLDELLLNAEIPGCAPADDYAVTDNPRIVVSPGMPLAAFIDQALTELDQLYVANRKPLPPATRGNYTTTTRIVGVDGADQTYVDFRYRIEAHHEEPDRPLPRIADAPPRAEVVVHFPELEHIAVRLDKVLDDVDSDGYRAKSVRRFEQEVRDRAGDKIKELDLAAGELNELLAYTGFGKSVVLIESFACWAAQNNIPVAFVLPTNADVVNATYQIGEALKALGTVASVVPLVSPRSLIRVAETAAARATDGGPPADWIWERFGYGCALAAVASNEKSVDGWVPGREPCATLRQPVPNRKDRTMSCPWRTTCGRYRAAREACTADVIVTSHANLQLGMLQTPVHDGFGRNDRVTVEELLLRRCQVVVIDEIDAFQRSMIEQSGRGLVLDRGGRINTPLRRLDQDFGAAFGSLSDEVDASVRDAYFVLRYLAETYVSHLRYERLGAAVRSKKRKNRSRGPARDWIVPQRWDNELANRLFGQPFDADPTDEQMRLYRSVFPDQPAPEPEDPPKYQEMRDLLQEVVTNGLGGQAIAAARAKLAEFFDLVAEHDQALVANQVLRRTILERIRWSLHSLMANNAQLVDIGVESAQHIADALGTYGRWRVMPTGPLGRLVFAFTEYHDDSGNEPAQLSTAAFGGDPHLYATSLGDITAMAQARTRRIVLGMSATSCFPHAPHSHLHVSPKWWVADDDNNKSNEDDGKVKVVAERIADKAGRVLKVSGLDGKDRADALVQMSTLLWPKLDDELRSLLVEDRDRARVLLATTSYDGARQVAQGLANAGVPAGRVCLAVRPRSDEDTGSAIRNGQWWELPANRLESFPGIGGADILIAPLARVQRGVNIIGAGDRSAVGSVWLLVRPIPLIDEPAELLAHIQARALTCHPGPSGDPLGLLEERRKTAGTYFEQIVRRPPYFRCQPREVKLGVAAEIVVGAIQLIGRARRGGTAAVLHLVDGAFTDGSTGTSFASLIRGLRDEWRAGGVLSAMEQYYGRTLRAFFEFADRPETGDESC